jgi:hypothetical protein
VQKKGHSFTTIFGKENIFSLRKNAKFGSVPKCAAAQNSDTYRLDSKVV